MSNAAKTIENGLRLAESGAAVAATWIVRGDESRRRRGRGGDIPWRRVAATPRPRRGYSVESRRRRGRDVLATQKNHRTDILVSFRYRYLLERFAADGYLVVATPYRLSFDYQAVCDAVEASYDAARAEAITLGYDSNLDVISVGHSCGALLQALVATRRPRERRRLALVSYNNKPATDAIPLFEQVVAGARNQSSSIW